MHSIVVLEVIVTVTGSKGFSLHQTPSGQFCNAFTHAHPRGSDVIYVLSESSN